MPTDAPDGNINAAVVRGRRSDHVPPKTPRARPAHEKAADVTTEDIAPAKKAAAPKATTKAKKG